MPANKAASATDKSESADGSGTPTVDVAPPPVIDRSSPGSEQVESLQLPSPPAMSPVVRESVTVPPVFSSGPLKSRANNGVPVRSLAVDPSHNVVMELVKTGLIVMYVPTDVVISMLVKVVPLNMNDPDAVVPSLNVTHPVGQAALVGPVNVQRIESAEAMLGRDNRASSSTAENTLRITSRFIIPPSLRCRLTR